MSDVLASMYDNLSTISPADEEVVYYDDTKPLIPLTKENFKEFMFVISMFLVPISGVLGIITNAIGLYVLRTESTRGKNNFYFYMFIIMSENIIKCSNFLIYNLSWMVMVFDPEIGNYMETYTITGHIYITKVFNHFVVTILIQMSSERLFSLLQPFSFSQMWLFKYTRQILFCSFIFYGIVLIPLPACCYPTELQVGNQTVFAVVLRDTEFWPEFMTTFVFYETLVLSVICPLLLLAVNASIPIAYYRYTKRSGTAKNNDPSADKKRRQQQNKITIVTLTTAISYFILSLPNMIAFSFEYFDASYGYFGEFSHIFNFWINLGTFLTLANSVSDSVIYVLISRNLWAKLTRICCRSPSEDASIYKESTSDTKVA